MFYKPRPAEETSDASIAFGKRLLTCAVMAQGLVRSVFDEDAVPPWADTARQMLTAFFAEHKAGILSNINGQKNALTQFTAAETAVLRDWATKTFGIPGQFVRWDDISTMLVFTLYHVYARPSKWGNDIRTFAEGRANAIKQQDPQKAELLGRALKLTPGVLKALAGEGIISAPKPDETSAKEAAKKKTD